MKYRLVKDFVANFVYVDAINSLVSLSRVNVADIPQIKKNCLLLKVDEYVDRVQLWHCISKFGFLKWT